MGDFCFLGSPAPESCRRDEKIRAPEKKFPAPEFFFQASKIFFPAPFFLDGGPEALFPAIWNFFTDKSPMSICRHKPRPADVPRQSLRGNSRTRDKKEACTLCLPTFGFPHVPRDCVFCTRHHPLPRTSESQRLQMTKCQIHGQIAKCQIRRSVPAGKHETVPRYISTAPLLSLCS